MLSLVQVCEDLSAGCLTKCLLYICSSQWKFKIERHVLSILLVYSLCKVPVTVIRLSPFKEARLLGCLPWSMTLIFSAFSWAVCTIKSFLLIVRMVMSRSNVFCDMHYVEMNAVVCLKFDIYFSEYTQSVSGGEEDFCSPSEIYQSQLCGQDNRSAEQTLLVL